MSVASTTDGSQNAEEVVEVAEEKPKKKKKKIDLWQKITSKLSKEETIDDLEEDEKMMSAINQNKKKDTQEKDSTSNQETEVEPAQEQSTPTDKKVSTKTKK